MKVILLAIFILAIASAVRTMEDSMEIDEAADNASNVRRGNKIDSQLNKKDKSKDKHDAGDDTKHKKTDKDKKDKKTPTLCKDNEHSSDQEDLLDILERKVNDVIESIFGKGCQKNCSKDHEIFKLFD